MKQCRLKSDGELQESLQGYRTAEAHSNHPPNEEKSIFKRLDFNLRNLNCLAEEVEGF